MKKTALFISAIAIIFGAVSCKEGQTNAQNTVPSSKDNDTTTTLAPAGSIVYFNLDKVIEEYDMANDLRAVVETKVESISQDVNRRQSKLEKDIKTFQDKINKGLLVSSVAQQQQEKLQQDQLNFQNFAAQKQQEIAEEQQVMLNQIADAINNYIAEYNKEKGFAMILSTQGGILPAPVVTADPSLDITEDLLAGLNATYVKEKGKTSAE